MRALALLFALAALGGGGSLDSRMPDAAVRLPSGDVLVAGGGESVERGGPGGRFVLAGTVGGPFSFATATLTAAGRVLVAGGYDDSIVPTADAWIFSP